MQDSVDAEQRLDTQGPLTTHVLNVRFDGGPGRVDQQLPGDAPSSVPFLAELSVDTATDTREGQDIPSSSDATTNDAEPEEERPEVPQAPDRDDDSGDEMEEPHAAPCDADATGRVLLHGSCWSVDSASGKPGAPRRAREAGRIVQRSGAATFSASGAPRRVVHQVERRRACVASP